MIYSFLFFLFCFLVVGILSATRKQANTEDYLIAGRSVNPWLTALSAVATNNSGFMFVGLIGTTYLQGLSSMWLMVGLACGEYLSWRWVFRRLRERSQRVAATTIPFFLGVELGPMGPKAADAEEADDLGQVRVGEESPAGRRQLKPLRRGTVVVVAGLITLVFLSTYAAAQLTAGSKALHVLFGWDYMAGALIGAGIVAAYCFASGIRASIWTDAAQSAVMLASMLLLLLVSLRAVGGMEGLWSRLDSIDPALVNWRPQDLQFGFLLYLIGWIAAGVGVLGQPHVMIRVMAIDSSDNIPRARRIYFSWYIVFAASAVLVGLCCRALLPEGDIFDSELALPRLSQQLLPGVLVGLILAGLFSATISTADSQILACSAALTQDLFPRWGKSYKLTKLGTLIITAVVVGIVMLGNQSVFQLVVLSWSALASGLGPLLAIRSLEKPVSSRTAVAMILAGITTVLIWRYQLGFSDAVYDVLPGLVVGFATYAACAVAGWNQSTTQS